ncbi:MAG: glycosyltransferase [Fibrobacter sp.]|nr:glycosyltransferase [Fibrobacter sp.]
MIPKVIHYCWFGHNKLPPLAKKCIASWRKFLPDYEIKEWNEDNFDVNNILYTKQAYKHKKFAFVSDYARFKILYEYGGIYFDTDVEVIKSLDDILAKGSFFGLENESHFACNPGLGFACKPKFHLLKEMLDLYANIQFETTSGTLNKKTIVKYFSEMLSSKGLQASPGIINFEEANFYPAEYFCPKPSEFGKIQITENTRTIHHYAASWIGPKQRFANFMIRIFGKKLIMKLYNLIK